MKAKKERNPHGFRIYIIIEKREVLPHHCGEKVSVQRVKLEIQFRIFERFSLFII
jgi:hypothetical protein